MNQLEKCRLESIETRLTKCKHLLEAIMPVHIQVDRRRKSLELQINQLEEERTKLLHGQLVMRFDKLQF